MQRFRISADFGLSHRAMRTVVTALIVLPVAAGTGRSAPPNVSMFEVPGPSEPLFSSPFYACTRNYYVSPTGNDSNNGSQSAPWASLQHADGGAGGRVAGDCVNVAPGKYIAGVHVNNGGNHAAADGYVVYRCQTIDGCQITAVGGNGAPAFTFNTVGGPNYVVIDGFELVASTPVPYGVGILITNNVNGAPVGMPASHHIWMINNIIHGYGEAGIGTNEADWIFVLHNSVYDNARATCDAQGSGIALVVAKATPNYTPTAADNAWTPFHQVIAWNVAHDNMLTGCGKASDPYNTDGNGIIMDTFDGSGVDRVLYPHPSLVANNIIYGNGGKGIAVFRTSYVTVASNTVYDNNLDPWNQGFPRGEIQNAGGAGNTYVNNIVYALPAANPSDPRCQGATYALQPAPCPLMANAGFVGGDAAGIVDAGNTWVANISFGGTELNIWARNPDRTGNFMFNGDHFSCALNKCGENPHLAKAEDANFALASESSAIGYGQLRDYLSPNAIDAGACHHALARCP